MEISAPATGLSITPATKALFTTATLGVGKVLLGCVFSFDFDRDLLLLFLLSLDADLFRLLSLDTDRDLRFRNRDLDLERDLRPLDLERDCLLLEELLLLERDLRDLERDLDQRLLKEPTPLLQRGLENLRKFGLNAGDFLRDLERDLLCLGDLDLLLYERERDRDFEKLFLRCRSLERDLDFDFLLDDLFLERDLDLDFFLELDSDLDFLLVFRSLELDLECLFLEFLDDLASGDFDLLLEFEALFFLLESLTFPSE